MAEETAAAPAPTPAPAAPAKAKPFTPTAREIPFCPREVFSKLIADVKFDGNPHPGRKKAVEAALAILTAELGEADAFRAVVSTSGTDTGHRIEVQVTSQKYPTE
jgi:hypothetical protein